MPLHQSSIQDSTSIYSKIVFLNPGCYRLENIMQNNLASTLQTGTWAARFYSILLGILQHPHITKPNVSNRTQYMKRNTTKASIEPGCLTGLPHDHAYRSKMMDSTPRRATTMPIASLAPSAPSEGTRHTSAPPIMVPTAAKETKPY